MAPLGVCVCVVVCGCVYAYLCEQGRRKDYTPYNCTKIIMGTAPGNGEYHGCPFKHYDEGSLSRSALPCPAMP
jgi:DNA primase large subunit